MKKLVINISDVTWERLRFEAMFERKSIPEILTDRIFYKPFNKEVEAALDALICEKITQITNEA